MPGDIIPAALRERVQWVIWRYEKEGVPAARDTDGATKIPYNAKTGHKASSTNANTWTSYDVAVASARARGYAGVGYVFAKDDPFTGIDLDDCIDESGQVMLWGLEIVNNLLSYTEVSPSGRGLKIWVEGSIPTAIKQPYASGKIEMYDRGRYFTVTGQHLDGTPLDIRNANGALSALYATLKPADAPALSSRAVSDDHTQAWARKKLADAIRMVVQAGEGMKHDVLLDAARLAGGACPHISESEIETALFAAISDRAADKSGARKTIRDGIGMGRLAPLDPPPPPAQPLFDAEGFACCPVHHTRLPRAKNGNGYKCHDRDASTPSGYCDFWWKGEGYIEPAAHGEPEPPPQADGPTVENRSALRYDLYRLSDLRKLPPVSWLIPNELPAGLFTVICGPSGAGKSFLAIDYALTVARANPDRLVVYVAPEGGGGYHLRADAWLAHHGGEEPQNLMFVLREVSILDPLSVAAFIATIKPLDPLLVTLDTLARCMVGGDENSARDMGLFVRGCDTIRQETRAAVSVVHHSGKSGSGYRGSSALYAASDNWIDVANDDGLITVSCGKAKDWQPFSPRYLRLVEQAASCILLPSDQVSSRGSKLTEGQRKTLEILALDIFIEPGAKRTEIVAATGITDVTMYRILSRLKRDGLISQGSRGDPYRIAPAGLTEIKNYHRALRDQRAELSQLSPTINQPLTNYQSLSHPYIRGDSDSDSDSESGERKGDDLFPEPSLFVDRFDWAVVQKFFDQGNQQAIKLHCAVWHHDYEEVMTSLRAGEERI